MAFDWDPVLLINLVLCIIIVVLGYLCSARTGEKLPLFIAAAFGLFGLSHAASLFGVGGSLTVPLILVRALAYLLVVYSLYRYLQDSLAAKESRQAWIDYFREDAKKGGK